MDAQFDKRKMFGNSQPTGIRDFSDIGQLHVSVYDLAEITYPVFGADGHEIGRVPTIIPPRSAGGLGAVFILVFFSRIFFSENTATIRQRLVSNYSF